MNHPQDFTEAAPRSPGVVPQVGAAPPPVGALFALAGSYVMSRALHAAARLGVADQLATTPMHIGELASAVGADRVALCRLLRVLVAHGIFHETENDHFVLNAQAEPLRKDSPQSVLPFILSTGSEWSQQLWNGAMHAMQTGRPAFDHVFGTTLFQFFQRNPEAGAVFDEGLACLARHVAPAILDAYDFTRHSRIVDVGGGSGMLLATILRASEPSRGVLLESAPVIERAGKVFTALGLGDRCELVVGSFFEAVPEGGDAYVLKNVLHDWQDEQAIEILKNCHRAMAPNGRVLIVEAIVGAEGAEAFPALMDLNMLMTTGGVERTESQFRELCTRAGLKIDAIEKCLPFHLLQATKA